MKIKTADLTQKQLDYIIAKCEGLKPITNLNVRYQPNQVDLYEYNPSTDWAQGGPIIEREKLQLSHQSNGKHKDQWSCNIWLEDKSGALRPNTQYGETPLIAAMRCYVASKLGDTVDIPAELV